MLVRRPPVVRGCSAADMDDRSFVQALGDRAGSGDALQGSAGLVSRAASVARPPGSWVPPSARTS